MKTKCTMHLAFAAALILIGLHASPATAQSNAWDGTTATGITGGDGSQVTPYLISSGAELAFVAQQVNAGTATYAASGVYFQLDADIDLGGKPWPMIGADGKDFKGHFDGDGHTISGLNVGTSSQYCNGLFRYVYGGTISNLKVSGTVKSQERVGLLVGAMGYDAVIENCVTTGSVAATNANGRAGGLMGYNGGGIIRNCYSTATVTAPNRAGGLVGELNNEQGTATLSTSYSTGAVSGTGTNGGLVGYVNSGITVTSCYYDQTTSGQSDNGKGTGMSTTDMKTISTYTGWDFTNTWTIAAGEYPKLA